MLPDEEVAYIKQLTFKKRDSRLALLHEAGWSFASLGTSIDVPKTTVHFWVRNASKDPQLLKRPIPQPHLSLPKTLSNGYPLRTRAITPKVPPSVRPRLRELSQKSRRYRAKSPADSPVAQANKELTTLALNLRSQGVPTSDIADAAGVSYRAMARRIANGQKDA